MSLRTRASRFFYLVPGIRSVEKSFGVVDEKNAEVIFPTFDKMMAPALQALVEGEGSASNQERVDRVVQFMGLAEEEEVALQGANDRRGLVISTGRFTDDSKREASRDGAPPVVLIDGNQFCELLKTLGLGVKTELVEQVVVRSEFLASI